MAEIIEGNSDAAGLRFGILAARFHDEIVSGLLSGALGCLQRHGAGEAAVTVYRAPGSFELPGLAKEVASLGRYDALIALGVLIRGDTPHFDFISAQVISDLSRVAIDERLPIALGVITCNTLEQAQARCGPRSGNKGWEAALAAIEMANLFKVIRRSSTGKERS